jgi:phosphonatase-like hydrolase
MIKLAVFDLAGTTIDEQNVVYKTVHRAVESVGYDVDYNTVLLYAAGKEKRRAIQDVMEHVEGGWVDSDIVDDAYARFEQMLDMAYRDLTPLPMPDSAAVFAALREKNVKIALNTGYRRAVADQLLQKIGWMEGREYDLLVTADDVKRGRPNPDMIFVAMERLGVTDAKTVLKIGDSVADIEEGRNAGCGMVLGITTGAQTAAQMAPAQPDYIVNQLIELLDNI